MLGQLSVYIKQTRDDFVQRTASGGKGPPKGKNLPETVNNIVWVRQLEAKVRFSVNAITLESAVFSSHKYVA